MLRMKVLLSLAAVFAMLAVHHGWQLQVPFLVRVAAPADTPPRVTQPVTPAPADGSLQLTVSPGSSALNPGSRIPLSVLVTLTGAQLQATKRLPVNLALVLDRSGSMAARNKLEYAKQAARIAVDELAPTDRVAIVAFDSVSTVVLPSTQVSDKAAIHAIIESLTPGGSTNISQGILDGRSQVMAHFRKDQINRVVLMTDGLANFGETSPDGIARLAQETGQQGVAVTALGLGADYNEDVLVKVAEYSGGRYSFIENPEKMVPIFRAEVKDLLQTVARDVALRLTPTTGVTVEEVMGYRGPAGKSLQELTVGDFHSGQSRSFVVRLTVDAADAGARELLQVQLAYTDTVKGQQPRKSSAPVQVDIQAQPDAAGRTANRTVLEKEESMRAATRLEEAMQCLNSGKKEKAQQILASQLSSTREQNQRYYHSRALTSQINRMEQAAQTMQTLPAESEDFRNFIKSNKQDAYLMTR